MCLFWGLVEESSVKSHKRHVGRASPMWKDEIRFAPPFRNPGMIRFPNVAINQRHGFIPTFSCRGARWMSQPSTLWDGVYSLFCDTRESPPLSRGFVFGRPYHRSPDPRISTHAQIHQKVSPWHPSHPDFRFSRVRRLGHWDGLARGGPLPGFEQMSR